MCFLCKVAAADDERYLVCATGAAGVVSCANPRVSFVQTKLVRGSNDHLYLAGPKKFEWAIWPRKCVKILFSYKALVLVV